MAEQNFPDNATIELDNPDVLRGMNSETVDLIATDPPFNTKRNRAGTAGLYVDNWKWGDTGKLPDQWAWNEVHPIWLEEIRDDNRALHEVIEAAGHCHGQGIAAFLCFLSVRLIEMHRVLKPTGSLYLHCDDTDSCCPRITNCGADWEAGIPGNKSTRDGTRRPPPGRERGRPDRMTGPQGGETMTENNGIVRRRPAGNQRGLPRTRPEEHFVQTR